MGGKRHHRAAVHDRRRDPSTEPVGQRRVVDLDPRRDECGADIEDLFDVAVAPIEVDRDHVAVVEDLTDEIGACSGRAVLDEDADPVVVGGPDRRGEVDGVLRLRRDRLGTRLHTHVVGARHAVRVEAHTVDGGDGTRVDPDPRLVELGTHLGDVAGEVVADRPAALGAECPDHPLAAGGIAADDDVAACVDQHHVHAGFIDDRRSDLVERGEHVPHGPLDVRHPPGACDRRELDRDLPLEHPAVDDLAMHGVHVVPHTEREQRVGLARRVPDGGGGVQAEHAAGQLGVDLAQQGRAPEIVSGKRVVVSVEDPRRDVTEWEVGGVRCGEFGKRADQLRAHSVVGGPAGGEDERHLAIDRRHSIADAGTSGVTVVDVSACSTCSGGELLRTRGDDRQTGRSGVRLVPGIESREHLGGVAAREGVDLGRGDTARRVVVGGLGEQERTASDAVETCRLDRHGARTDPVGEPVTGLVVRGDQRNVADGHTMAEGDHGGGHVHQA